MWDTALDIMFKNIPKGTLRKLPNHADKMLGNGSIKTVSALCNIIQFFTVCVLLTIVQSNLEYRSSKEQDIFGLQIWMPTEINTILECTDCFLGSYVFVPFIGTFYCRQTLCNDSQR